MPLTAAGARARVPALLLGALLAAACGPQTSDTSDEVAVPDSTADERSEVVVLKPQAQEAPEAAEAPAAVRPATAEETAAPRRSGARTLAPPAGEPTPEAAELAIEVRAAEPRPAPDAARPAAPAAAPDEADAGPAQAVVFDPKGEFTVQIGLFADAPTARRLVRELAGDGYPAYSLPAGPKGVRVRIGYFRTREEAARFGEIFRRDRGMAYWVDRRRGER